MLEKIAFEVELDAVTLVNRIEKLCQHLLLRVAYESFAAKITILG